MAWIEERKTKDGKIKYRVMIRLKGAPTLSATFDRRTDAKLWIQQQEVGIRTGRHLKTAEAKKHTLGELIDRYIREELPKKPKSLMKQSKQLLWWKGRIGANLLSDVTPALISECREALLGGLTPRKKKRSPATVVRYLAALSHVFSIAIREYAWVEDNACSRVKKPRESRGRVRFLDDEERARLLEACRQSRNPYLHLITVLALSSGMRLNEILGLTWKDVDFERKRIILQQTKNGERRVVPISGYALELLTTHFHSSKTLSMMVFPSKLNPKKSIDIRSAWEAAIAKANIHDFKFHDCRHCAASYLAMNGASLAEIAEVLGHKTLQMVKRYAHLSEAHTAGIVEKMNKKIFG